MVSGDGRPVRRPGSSRPARRKRRAANAPLADRLRPTSLDEVVGQEHLTGPDGAIGRMVAAGRLASMILWGPPGTGKTSIARLLADAVGLRFVAISAVFSGVADLKKMFAEARTAARAGQQTLLFVDEIHRFNRAQQDGFLPYVEDGTVTLVGATTENPSFEINAALLSRCQVLILRRLDHDALEELVRRAEALEERPLPVTAEAREALIASADGDGRFLLNQVETLFSIEIDEPLGPAELSPTCSTAACRSTTRTARAITTSSPRSTKRSAARTRRPRFIISRACWSPARSRSTCFAA